MCVFLTGLTLITTELVNCKCHWLLICKQNKAICGIREHRSSHFTLPEVHCNLGLQMEVVAAWPASSASSALEPRAGVGPTPSLPRGQEEQLGEPHCQQKPVKEAFACCFLRRAQGAGGKPYSNTLYLPVCKSTSIQKMLSPKRLSLNLSPEVLINMLFKVCTCPVETGGVSEEWSKWLVFPSISYSPKLTHSIPVEKIFLCKCVLATLPSCNARRSFIFLFNFLFHSRECMSSYWL